MITNRTNISNKFENGDIPSQSDFQEIFDSFVHKDEDKADFQMVQAGTDTEHYVTPELLRSGLQNLGIITGNCYMPYKENFDGNLTPVTTLPLSKSPIEYSVRVYKNGQLLTEEEDYTLDYNTGVLTFSSPVSDRNIEVDYWYKNFSQTPGDTDITDLVSSPFKKIEEGNGDGIVLKDRNPLNYGPIGFAAIDFSKSYYASDEYGAKAWHSTILNGQNQSINQYSEGAIIGGGYGNTIQGKYCGIFSGAGNSISEPYAGTSSFIGGGTGNEISGASSSGYNIIVGGNGNINKGYYASILGGTTNTIDTNSEASVITGGSYNKITTSGSFIGSGGDNTAAGFRSSVITGTSNVAKGNFSTVLNGVYNQSPSFGEISGGTYSTIYTPASSTDIVSTDKIFNIGIGTSDTSRKDAISIYKNGLATLPTVSKEQINNASGKAIITKEWAETQRPYKVYVALLRIMAGACTVINEFENTTGVTPSFYFSSSTTQVIFPNAVGYFWGQYTISNNPSDGTSSRITGKENTFMMFGVNGEPLNWTPTGGSRDISVEIRIYPGEVTRSYFNTERTLSAAKNNCSSGYTGSTVTLVANAGTFSSPMGYAEANALADAWLAQNAQANANTLGTCALPDTTPPPVPTLSGTFNNTTRALSLSWNAVTDPSSPVTYKVYSSNVLQDTVTSTSQTFYGAYINTGSNSWTVRSVDSAGNISANSNTYTFTAS
jgi:hypothetical protein